MTRTELIAKAEEQLNYILKQMNEAATPEGKRTFAEIGRHQLDMVLFLLDNEYEDYDKWFNKFF